MLFRSQRYHGILSARLASRAHACLTPRRRRDIVDVEMRNEFTAVFERDGRWYVAYCPEIPGANGQGRTKSEARRSLLDAIALILKDRREDWLKTGTAG